MKIIKLFSALLLLSTTGVNTSVAMQQVAYAETVSSADEIEHPENEDNTDISSFLPELIENTDQSSDNSQEVETVDDLEEEDRVEDTNEKEDSKDVILEENLLEDVPTDEHLTAEQEEQDEEQTAILDTDTEAESLEILVENEGQFRAILLGEVYTDGEGIAYNYAEIANDCQLILTFSNDLILTAPIADIQRTNIALVGQHSQVRFSQSAAEHVLQFANPVHLTWQNMQLQNIISAQGLAQTMGASVITFDHTQMSLTSNTGRVVNNDQAHLQFKGDNLISTATSDVPTLFIANRMAIDGKLTIDHRSSNGTPMFHINQVAIGNQAELSVTRSSNSNAGSVFHLTGTAAMIQLGENSTTIIRQSGPFISLPNANQDSRLTLASRATLDLGTGQGLSGNSTSTIGEVLLKAGSHLKFSEYGTVSTAPAMNVGHRFIVEDSTADQPTILEGNRSGTTAGAFIHLRAANSEVRIGAFTDMSVNQTGPVVTASLADIFIGEQAKINATVGNGFTANTLVKSVQMKDGSQVYVNERISNNADVRRFYVRDSFITGDNVTLDSTRTTTGGATFLELQAANARFISGANNQMTIYQRGAIFTGAATTSELHFGADNQIHLTSGRGLTGNTGATSRMIVGKYTKISVIEHGTNDNQHFIRLRDELRLEDGAELYIKRTSNRLAEAIRLTRANAHFSMGTASKLSIEVRGIAFFGTTTTDVYIGDLAEIDSKASYGFTGRRTVRSIVTGKDAIINHTEATTGNLVVGTGLSDSPFRVSHTFTLGEGSVLNVLRERNTNDAGAIRVNNAAGVVTLKKNANMNIRQVGSAFYAPGGASFIMEDGASFYGKTANGFNSNNRRFSQMTIGKNADFFLTDEGMTNRTNSRPMIDVMNTITVEEDAQFVVDTHVDRAQMIYFRNARANLNINNVQLFELTHPNTRAGNSRSTMQRLIRSGNYTVANGLTINFESQKISLWTGTQAAPDHEFMNVTGTLRMNQNNGVRPSWGTFDNESRSRYMSVQDASGTLESMTWVAFADAISNNNYRRLAFSEAEGLVARIDPLSDQSTEISGSMFEDTDVTIITYTNTAGELVELDKDSPRIEWGGYRDEDQIYRYFRIPLAENERLETDTELSIFLSKPSVETYVDITASRTVIKGIESNAYNVTLDRFKINDLLTNEALYDLIIEESRAEAINVLTEMDMTEDFRVVDSDLTWDVEDDGSYYAVLEVGNKAYQMLIGIDVTSKLDHMRVTIPTKMVFESLYNAAESNRNFESPEYEIRNQSQLAVDTYINQMDLDNSEGIVLLKEGEDPLDYAASESEEEDPEYTLDDISTPLLRLSLKAEDTEIQLYEEMEEAHLIRLSERSRVPISLTGDFYGDYPRWVTDTDAEQGGYYEDLLVPNYRIILRFVPRD